MCIASEQGIEQLHRQRRIEVSFTITKAAVGQIILLKKQSLFMFTHCSQRYDFVCIN